MRKIKTNNKTNSILLSKHLLLIKTLWNLPEERKTRTGNHRTLFRSGDSSHCHGETILEMGDVLLRDDLRAFLRSRNVCRGRYHRKRNWSVIMKTRTFSSSDLQAMRQSISSFLTGSCSSVKIRPRKTFYRLLDYPPGGQHFQNCKSIEIQGYENEFPAILYQPDCRWWFWDSKCNQKHRNKDAYTQLTVRYEVRLTSETGSCTFCIISDGIEITNRTALCAVWFLYAWKIRKRTDMADEIDSWLTMVIYGKRLIKDLDVIRHFIYFPDTPNDVKSLSLSTSIHEQAL